MSALETRSHAAETLTRTSSSAGLISAVIIVPSFNSADTIAETLASLQACADLDKIAGGVVLVDNASTDSTIQTALEAWYRKDVTLEVVRRDRNVGPDANVNCAFAEFGGGYDWLMILHADDLAKQTWLTHYMARIEAVSPNVASICSSYDCWFPSKGKTFPGEDDLNATSEVIVGSKSEVACTLMRGCWWQVSGCAIRTSAFPDVGPFSQDNYPYAADFDWLLRCLHLGFDIEYIPRTTVIRRCHSRQLSCLHLDTGQDLEEWLTLARSYHRSGELTMSAFTNIRSKVLWTACRRALRRMVHLRIGETASLLRVASLALGRA